MFQTADQYNIEDFLKSLDFIAPKGMDISYFVVPISDHTTPIQKLAPEAGYQPISNTQKVPGVTDTQVYTRKNVKNIHSISSNRVNPIYAPPPMGREGALQPLSSEILTTGGIVDSPEKLDRLVRVVESTSTTKTIQLKKDIGVFPAFTIFKCKKV